jgi:hypothetical protein
LAQSCDDPSATAHDPSMARSNPSGEWTQPTREVRGSQLIKLLDESRQPVVEVVHDEPTRKVPATSFELLERSRRNSSQVRSLSELAIPVELAIGTDTNLAAQIEVLIDAMVEPPKPAPPPRRNWLKISLLAVVYLGLLTLIGASVFLPS